MKRSSWVKDEPSVPDFITYHGAGVVDQVVSKHAGLPKEFVRIVFSSRPDTKTLQKLRRSVFMYGWFGGEACWYAAYTPTTRAWADLVCSKAENWESVGEHPSTLWDDMTPGDMGW